MIIEGFATYNLLKDLRLDVFDCSLSCFRVLCLHATHFPMLSSKPKQSKLELLISGARFPLHKLF